MDTQKTFMYYILNWIPEMLLLSHDSFSLCDFVTLNSPGFSARFTKHSDEFLIPQNGIRLRVVGAEANDDAMSILVKRRLNTQQNHMGATEP